MSDEGGSIVMGPWSTQIADPIEDDIYRKHEVDHEVRIIKIEPKPIPAAQILQESKDLISNDRQEQHGDPKTCHDEIAKLWTWWTGFKVDAHDVAMMMMLLKTARIKTGGYNRDCYVDGPAYFALAGQMRIEDD